LIAQDNEILLASRRLLKDNQTWNLFDILGEQAMYKYLREELLEIYTDAFTVFIRADIWTRDMKQIKKWPPCVRAAILRALNIPLGYGYA
jgi:hypothetical protein